MKAISLWQPWASLWLSKLKLHETRSWHITKQWREWQPGDRMAIHASQKFIKDHDSDFAEILREEFGALWYRELPTGALLGTIAVSDCQLTETIFRPGQLFEQMTMAERVNYQCGDFYEGRYAWEGAEPIIFKKPIPYRGQQGIFSVPDELIQAASV